jgi:alpha-N-arabinofuranosidase
MRTLLRVLLPLALVCSLSAAQTATPTVTIDATAAQAKVSPLFHGLMTEEINHETPFEPWNPKSQGEPPTPNMRAAIGDAAFLTQMEKNSDIVIMNAYAPLLVNVNPGARQWRPNLIGYDGLRVYGSPSYYAIKLFSTNLGDEILRSTATDTDVLASVTRDSRAGTIYVKLVNPTAADAPVRIDLAGVKSLAPTATAMTLAADPQATNTIDAPQRVVPVTSTVSGVRPGFTYTVPRGGIVSLTLRTR